MSDSNYQNIENTISSDTQNDIYNTDAEMVKQFANDFNINLKSVNIKHKSKDTSKVTLKDKIK